MSQYENTHKDEAGFPIQLKLLLAALLLGIVVAVLKLSLII